MNTTRLKQGLCTLLMPAILSGCGTVPSDGNYEAEAAFAVMQLSDTTYRFQAYSRDPGTSHRWDFGDGSRDTGPVVSHTYMRPPHTRYYTVTHQLRSSNGRSSVYSQAVPVKGLLKRFRHHVPELNRRLHKNR